jgi:hypothetical protein
MGKFVNVRFTFARKEARVVEWEKWLKETRLRVGTWWATHALSIEM